MIKGQCLCGGVRFEIARAVGPFELCHCNRCRKVSGSAYMSAVGVNTADFHWIAGQELIASYTAPIIDSPPCYQVFFCKQCGSPVPPPEPEGDWFEIAAGLLDDDPGLQPDKHIYVEYRAPWETITDNLPQFDKPGIARHRRGDA